MGWFFGLLASLVPVAIFWGKAQSAHHCYIHYEYIDDDTDPSKKTKQVRPSAAWHITYFVIAVLFGFLSLLFGYLFYLAIR
ncbi:hypothetical protein ACCT07_35380 [Rhizobium johnstonii]|uniref:hypothetical protein n=1 Tax=Rhizobium johnstonii TaxID=3019933 RepID=UPI003F972A22